MADAAAGIKVSLVDDQALFRAGIQMLIESQNDMEFCGEASDGKEAVALATDMRPDVMLMDLRMPVMDGVTAIRHIVEWADTNNTDRPRIIALTTFNRDKAVVDAVQAGARRYEVWFGSCPARGRPLSPGRSRSAGLT